MSKQLQAVHIARFTARRNVPPMLSANPMMMKKRSLVRVASPNARKVAR